MQRDPAGYVDGTNIYEYVASKPTRFLDQFGLDITHPSDDRVRYTPGSGNYTFPPLPGVTGYGSPRGPTTAAVAWPIYPNLSIWRVPISLCHRDLDSSGATGIDYLIIEANNILVDHRYVHLGDPATGVVDGYGLYDTEAEAGDLPSSEKNLPGLKPKDCFPCVRSGGVLAYGSGAGKSSYKASVEEIRDCIKNARLTKDYGTYTYNCYDWSREATRDCGLSCGLRYAQ